MRIAGNFVGDWPVRMLLGKIEGSTAVGARPSTAPRTAKGEATRATDEVASFWASVASPGVGADAAGPVGIERRCWVTVVMPKM